MRRAALALAILPISLLTAGCAAGSADRSDYGTDDPAQIARIDQALKGLVPSAPRSCIHRSDVTQIKRFRNTILYEQGRALIYRNDVSSGCTGLTRGDIVVSETLTGELCAGDIVRTVSATAPGTTGSCVLSKFIPYRRP